MSSEPYVKVCATFYLKNAPKEQLGLRQESWAFGKEPVSLHELLGMIVHKLLGFYLLTMPTPTDELNAELDKFREVIVNLRASEGQG